MAATRPKTRQAAAPAERARRRGTSHAPAATRRVQILEGALACFSRAGFARATMDDVAEESRLSKGSLYRFFASKDEVLLAIFGEFEVQALAALDGAEEGIGAIERLRRCGASAAALLGSRTDLRNTWIDFFGHPASRERLRQMYRRLRRRLTQVIRQGIESGEIDAVDPAVVAAGLLGAVEGLLLQAMVDPRFDPQRHWAGVWTLLERGLRRTDG